MNQKTNIQLFDEITAKLFANLYESFPLPADINCLSVTGCHEVDECGRISREAGICVHTLRWLGDEGFINVGQMYQHGGGGIVLTSKGLAALKAVPSGLEGKTSIGERLQAAVNAGAIPTAVEILKLIFT